MFRPKNKGYKSMIVSSESRLLSFACQDVYSNASCVWAGSVWRLLLAQFNVIHCVWDVVKFKIILSLLTFNAKSLAELNFILKFFRYTTSQRKNVHIFLTLFSTC